MKKKRQIKKTVKDGKIHIEIKRERKKDRDIKRGRQRNSE